MAYSYVRYSGNGSTTNYTFSFPTISTDHIKVRVNGTLVTNWSFLNSSTIQFAAAPASGTVIEIRRETPKDSTIVNFTDGSVLLERDLDLLATWQLYLGQETEDDIEDTIRVDSQSRFDAQNRRIINVADPINAQDAVTKVYADAVIGQATAAASAAAAVQVALAADEAIDSAASALAAASSAADAAGSATTATTQASNAAASAVNAANSAAAAATALDNFDDRYLGQKASDPALDNDGNALVTGALYYNSTDGAMRVYTGTGWINASSAQIATMKTYVYVATAGQTTFSGNDVSNSPLTYVSPYLIVSLNGLELRPLVDYTATSGLSVVLTSAATDGDELQIQAFSAFNVANIQADNVSFTPSGTGSTPTTVQARMRDHDATPPLLRKPRKLFSKLFAAASGPSRLKTVVLGDSLSAEKLQHLNQSLDRRFGGGSYGGVNTSGNPAGGLYGTGGADCNLSTNSGCTAETGKYEYWPTGQVLRMDAGASAAWTFGGVNPTFTDIKVYYVKEPGAGTINLVVGGSTVATASANASAGLGVLSHTKALGQAAVSITTSGASVRVLSVHVSNSSASGVDVYFNMAVGGLLLANATSSAQGRAIWQAALADIAPDFITFEMDDAFGDGGANAAAFNLLVGILDAACPIADKLIIASTPRASDDAGKLAARDFLLNFCLGKDASYLFFDSYYLLGSYAQMNAIFGTDDGVHPTAAAEAYAAEVMWNFLGLNGFNLGYVSRAVNDPGTPSKLARNSVFQGPGNDRGVDVTVETDGSFGYDWTIKFPRMINFSSRGGYGSVNGTVWQFSGNTAVFPNVMPLGLDFNSAGNVRKLDTNTGSGYEFLRYRKTDNPNGLMNMETGLIRSSFTRAQLLAIAANQVLGAIAFCTDCTGGAQLVYARGTSPTDWATVDGKTAI